MTIVSNPVSGESPNGTMGIIAKVGDLIIGGVPITADVELPEIAMYFRVGDTGAGKTLILEGADKNPVVVHNTIQGEEILCMSKKIIYQATVHGTLYTTTALYVTWFGGQ